MIHSDWHLHSEYSYDSSLPLETVAQAAQGIGLCRVGITDHVNFNDEKFLSDARASARGVKEAQKKYPFLVLGAELTPIAKPAFDYIARTGTRDGYTAPPASSSHGIELALTKEEMMELGMRYAVGAAHWQIGVVDPCENESQLSACIREWYRQQMFLACDERVTILGHPWYHGRGIWYEDLSVIPHSMHEDIAAACKENGKYVECNVHFFVNKNATEKFRHQYASLLREMFERGLPITYASDAHNVYEDGRAIAEKYLTVAGFKEGDFSEIDEAHLW